jgi:hypothetical protein
MKGFVLIDRELCQYLHDGNSLAIPSLATGIPICTPMLKQARPLYFYWIDNLLLPSNAVLYLGIGKWLCFCRVYKRYINPPDYSDANIAGSLINLYVT